MLAAALVLAVLLAYLPVRTAGFIWDDDAHLTENPCIIGPLGFGEIWTSAEANYFPLVLTNLWVQHAFWGLRPLPYHLVNVLMHAAAALLLWRVLRQLKVPGAWLGAALWVLHPVQVESVAWISELKNTQSAVFYLLSIGCFLRWLDSHPAVGGRGSMRHYSLALAFALLAILSKPSTVMLPVILALCWWWRAGGIDWRRLGWLVPFFAISGIASGWTIWEQAVHSGATGAEWSQTWPERLIIAGRAPWFYLGKLCWPHPLIFVYPRWLLDATSVASFLPGLAAMLGLAWAWWRGRPLRPVLFAALVFGVSLFPVLGFFSVYYFRYSFVGDHFQYLASMAPLALAGAAITVGITHLSRRPSWLFPAVAAGLLAMLGALSMMQCRGYADEATLWRTTLAENPRCWLAENNLAKIVFPSNQDEALARYASAIRLNPHYSQAHYTLASALAQLGRWPEAEEHYNKALRIQPDFAEAHFNLANGLLRLGRLDEAVTHYWAAVRARPEFTMAYYNLGIVLERQGRIAEALLQYETARRLHPGMAMLQGSLGSAQLALGRIAEAIATLQEAARLEPSSAEFRYNLGLALAAAGRIDPALEQFQEAVRLQPRVAPLRSVFGEALLAAGRPQEAAAQFQEALRIDPSFAPAQQGLARLRGR